MQPDKTSDTSERINEAERRIERDTSLAKTWADWSKERDGTQAWPPPPKEIPTPGLSAHVELERNSTGLTGNVAAVLVITNDTASDVAVASVSYAIEPTTGAVPPPMVWRGGPGLPLPPVVPAHGQVAMPFTVGAFTQPQTRPAVTFWVGASVQFANDGTLVESMPAPIVVHPPV